MYALQSPLPGNAQTVPRSEITCLLLLVQQAQEGATLKYYTDHQPLRNNFNRGLNHCIKSINADLYRSISHEIEIKALVVSVIWLPAHSDEVERVIPDGITEFDLIINLMADKLAKDAAKSAELPVHIATNIN